MRHPSAWLLAACLILGASSHARSVSRTSEDAQALADEIQADVEAIRGLPFKRKVKADTQTREEFGKYVEKTASAGMPDAIARHYGKIVRRLGLYRGPEIEGAVEMMRLVASSQTAAYYDPERQTFFVLLQGLPDANRSVLYAHELYHGLQDQYFDLRKFVMDRRVDASFSADELLARRAVVEGEAMYVTILWTARSAMEGGMPPRDIVASILQQRTSLDVSTLRASMHQPEFQALVGDAAAASIEAIDHIPSFVIEGQLDAYFKGAYFTFMIHERGWGEVEKLYTEYPPESTEQILHPEKWFARESPTRIRWAGFDQAPALRDWELLDENVIGEVQLRHVLKEHGMESTAAGVAAGWDGDRYAVFKRKDSDATLLLLYTSWDTTEDAAEFADAYRRLLAVKYAGGNEPTQLELHGKDVVIVEGGTTAALPSLMQYARSATKTKRTH